MKNIVLSFWFNLMYNLLNHYKVRNKNTKKLSQVNDATLFEADAELSPVRVSLIQFE